MRPSSPIVVVALAAALVLGAGERVALACPACADGSGGSPAWLVLVLIGAPIAAFVATALVVRRLTARARRAGLVADSSADAIAGPFAGPAAPIGPDDR